jgi:Flp pilus assembly protein TadB
MNYTKTSAGVVAAVSGSVLYSSLTIAAMLVVAGAAVILLAAWRRRRHDRAQAR